MNLKRALKAVLLIIIVLVLCVSGLFVLIAWDDERELRAAGTQNSTYKYTKYVDIIDVIKEAYLAETYTSELSQHMAEKVFNYANYKRFKTDDSQSVQPFKIDFELKEICQTKDNNNDLIYVDMIYTLILTNANGKTSGAEDAHVTYTVKVDENGWYIIDKYERP